MSTTSQLDQFYHKNQDWINELHLLQKILSECGLHEEFKWRNPCFTYSGKNICILGVFKNSCVLSFIKGALLTDQNNILQSAGENSRSVKLMRFTKAAEIELLADEIRKFVSAAIDIEKKGLKIEPSKEALELPAELLTIFRQDSTFQDAFYKLTKGRQRGYLIYFSSAKQSKTIHSRIASYRNRIINGKGMLDCVCGLSKKMPSCDGSHKMLK